MQPDVENPVTNTIIEESDVVIVTENRIDQYQAEHTNMPKSGLNRVI